MADSGCYWVGFLMRDRLFNRGCNTAAAYMWKSYEKGNVYLLQKKINEGVWEYWWYRRTPKAGGRYVENISHNGRVARR